jgi:small-conductance mechanosensitive channel
MMAFINSLNPDLVKWLQALLVALLFFPIGYVLRRVVFYYFDKLTAGTENKYDDIISARSRWHVLFWSFLLGLYLAFKIAPVGAHTLYLVNKGVFALFMLSATFLIANIVSDIIKTYTQHASLDSHSTSLTDNLIKFAIIAMGALMLMAHFGISITPILTALGVGSLAVALALQDTLSNLFSGFYIIANKQVRTGDYILLDSGQEGHVLDIGWRATRIKQLSNNIILIPNSKLGTAIVTNFHLGQKELSVAVGVGVAYSSDLARVEQVTLEVAKETLKEVPGGVADFEPSVRYNAFGDSSINFNVGLRVKDFADQFLIKHEFIKRLHKRYNKEGIDIPFPQRVVHLVNPGNK